MAHELKTLLAAGSPQVFIREYWGQRAYHCGGDIERFHDLFGRVFSVDEIRTLTTRLAALDGVYAYGYPDTKAAQGAFAEHGDEPVLRVAPDSALDLVLSGVTATVPALERVSPELAGVCVALRRQMQAAAGMDCKLWLSGPSAGARMHMDGAHVFQCQMRGHKRWRIATEPVLPWARGYNAALPDGSARLHTDWGDIIDAHVDDCEFRELVMKPGDFLYLPSGTWHTTQAVGDDLSVSLSFCFRWMSFRNLLDQVLDDALAPSPGWRQMPPPAVSDGDAERLSPAQTDYLTARLDEVRALLNSLTPTSPLLHCAWKKVIARGRPLDEWNLSVDKPSSVLAQVEPDLYLRVAPTDPMTMAISDHEIYLFHGAEEICFDEARYFGFARELARCTERFLARDTLDWSDGSPYSWSDVQPMLATLLNIGVLQVVQESSVTGSH